jgi:molybdopterin-guanine dinucleotide biosynthesis protein A
VVEVNFDDEADAFRNINTIEELKGSEQFSGYKTQ